jgi:hypothetical protein
MAGTGAMAGMGATDGEGGVAGAGATDGDGGAISCPCANVGGAMMKSAKRERVNFMFMDK